MSIVDNYYKQELERLLCQKTSLNSAYPMIGDCYELDERIGRGYYWIYDSKKGFNVKIHDFFLKEDTLLEMSIPECLSIAWYDSIAGEQFSPYEQLRSCVIKTFLGGYEPFTAFIHKNIPIKSISIEYERTYYEKYLGLRNEGQCENPIKIFTNIDSTNDFPEMKQLLNQIRTFKGSFISTELFFEAKATEALSLLFKRSEQQDNKPQKILCATDVASLHELAEYIDHHYLEPLKINDLAKIVSMGPTKLKKCFKILFSSTITEYITRVRVEKAEHLLALTDLPISMVSKAVGYANAGYFAEVFYKGKGILPMEFRKTIINNCKI